MATSSAYVFTLSNERRLKKNINRFVSEKRKRKRNQSECDTMITLGCDCRCKSACQFQRIAAIDEQIEHDTKLHTSDPHAPVDYIRMSKVIYFLQFRKKIIIKYAHVVVK
jgi:hypothetical protein